MMNTSVKLRRRRLSCSTSVAALLAGAVIIGGIVPVQAASPNWIGAASGDWFSGANWDTNAAPAAVDNAFIDTTTPSATTLDGGVGTGTANIVSVNVGVSHTGNLTITNGGSLGETDGIIGAGTGSQGTVTVTGINSRWNSTDHLTVGSQGNGTLMISSGASVSDDSAIVGDLANSTGHVTVDGGGSSWNTTTQILVGNSGAGTLTLSNGGQATFLNTLLGFATGGTGIVSVIGTGSIFAGSSSSGLTVGFGGTGTLNILAGGRVNDAAAVVGALAGSVGNAVVDGSGSTWLNTGSSGNPIGLTVGDRGSGTLTISNDAIVQSLSSGPVTIANQAGSTGVLNIGSAPGAAAVAPGTLFSNVVQFGAGTGTINFNHNGSGYVFAA